MRYTQKTYLKTMRLKIGLRQKDVAALLGMNRGELSRMERSHRLPTISQLIAMEMLYGRHGQYLLNELAQKVRYDLLKHLQKQLKEVRGKYAQQKRYESLQRLILLLEE